MMKMLFVFLAFGCVSYAQPGSLCATDGSSASMLISPGVDFVTINSNGCPSTPHENRVGMNPNSATEQVYTFVIPVLPVFRSGAPNTRLQSSLGSVGIALNGVPIFGPAVGPTGGDAGSAEIDTFDANCAHSTRTGNYHNHLVPWTLETTYPRSASGHSALLGWMPDGFAIYGLYQGSGARPSDLDQYGGHSDADRGYHYHFTGPTGPCPKASNTEGGFPYIAKALRGCVPDNTQDASRFKQPESYVECVAAASAAPPGRYIGDTGATEAPTPATTASPTAAPTPATTASPTAAPTDAQQTPAPSATRVCAHDSSADGRVDVNDLAALLVEWGNCN